MKAPRKRLNVVFFCTDQQRWDQTGFSGNDLIRTPTLDRLAQDGVVFENHITASPYCMPSRASIFTGLYPRNHKLWNHAYRLRADRIVTIAEAFAGSGRSTHACGKMHLSDWGKGKASAETPERAGFWSRRLAPGWKGPYMGFEEVDLVLGHGFSTLLQGGHYAEWVGEKAPDVMLKYAPTGDINDFIQTNNHPWRAELFDLFPMEALDEREHYNAWISDRAVEFIESAGDDPFLLWVSYPDPHHPFAAPHPYCGAYPPELMPPPRRKEGELDDMPPYYGKSSRTGNTRGDLTDETMRRVASQSYGMVEHVDRCMAGVVDAVEDRGLADRTVFVFTSDHGEMLGNHRLLRKGNFGYRDLLRVPFFISGKPIRALRKVRRVRGYTSHVDIMPTLLSLCGIPAPKPTDGLDLCPVIRGEELPRDAVLCEWTSGPGRTYNQHIFCGNYRLTAYPEHPEWTEFFDLALDPDEFENRAGSPAYSGIIRRMKRRLADGFSPIDERRDILPFYADCSDYDELLSRWQPERTGAKQDEVWETFKRLRNLVQGR